MMSLTLAPGVLKLIFGRCFGRAGKVETLVTVLMGLEFQIEISGDKTVVMMANNHLFLTAEALNMAPGTRP